MGFDCRTKHQPYLLPVHSSQRQHHSFLTSPILPALHPSATTAYNAPTTLTFLPANRCHVTVNLHCIYVTFYKLHCPWSQVINTGQGNWMLIGETIDQSPEKIVSDWFDYPSHIDKQACRKRGDNRRLTASIHHHYYWSFVKSEGPVPAEWPRMMRLGNKIHLFLLFPQMASLHTCHFQILSVKRIDWHNNLTKELFFNRVPFVLCQVSIVNRFSSYSTCILVKSVESLLLFVWAAAQIDNKDRRNIIILE